MQPDTNLNSVGAPESAPPPNKWWQRGPKLFFIGGALLIVVVIGVFMALKGGSNNKNKDKDNQTSSAYYDRPGFDRKKLAGSIGDPAALVLKKSTRPVTYQNTKVVQACSVFGPDDIRATGLTLRPHSLTVAFARNYFDGQGKGVLRTSDFLQPVGDESNNCQFTLVDTSDKPSTLWVQVFQPPYSPVKALNDEVAKNKFHPAGQVGGLETFESVDQSSSVTTTTTTILRNGDMAIQITTTLTDKSKIQAILDRAARNFTQLLASPDGPAKVEFASPLMPKGGANACALLLASDIKSLFGEEVSPLVGEAATTAVGVINFRSGNDNHNFVTHDCERGAPNSEADAFSFNSRTVKLEATTYRDLEGAKLHMQFHQAQDKKVATINQKVGDEAFFSAGPGGIQEGLLVRKGQFILEFSNQDKHGTKEQLIALAQTVVDRIKE